MVNKMVIETFEPHESASTEQQVSVVKCSAYDLRKVETSLKRNLELIGGIERFVKSDQRVCFKVNLLAAASPENAITTHPVVIEALANIVQAAGGTPLVVDSPGSGISYNERGLRRVYDATGLLEMSERTGIELNWDTSTREVSFPEGTLMKRLDVITPVLDADVVIAMPKLKTHMLTVFTGALKILFGVIPGLVKVGYHANLPHVDQFSEMLLDIVSCIKPSLYVMDGILGMEGDGPGFHGKPREVGVLLASTSPVSIDLTACQIIGLDPMKVPTLRMAKSRGWWDGNPEINEVLGCSIEELFISDYIHPQTREDARIDSANMSLMERLLKPLVENAVTPQIVPHKDRCTACGTCVRSCPQKAITIHNKVAVVDDDNCIRCYCCHELCPEAAIDLKHSLTGRFLRRLGAMGSHS